jgi:hypothetical protein
MAQSPSTVTQSLVKHQSFFQSLQCRFNWFLSAVMRAACAVGAYLAANDDDDANGVLGVLYIFVTVNRSVDSRMQHAEHVLCVWPETVSAKFAHCTLDGSTWLRMLELCYLCHACQSAL